MSWNSKEYYHLYRDNGICPECRRRKVEPGKSRCAMCLYDKAEVSRNCYHNNKEVILNRVKQRRARLQAEGKCPNCGKDKPEDWNRVLCPICNEKRRLRDKRRYAARHGYYKAGTL